MRCTGRKAHPVVARVPFRRNGVVIPAGSGESAKARFFGEAVVLFAKCGGALAKSRKTEGEKV